MSRNTCNNLRKLFTANLRQSPFSIHARKINCAALHDEVESDDFQSAHKFKFMEESPALWKEGMDMLVGSDLSTLVSLVKKCSNAKSLSESKRVHAYILNSRHVDERFLRNLVMQMYGKCEDMENAREIFDRISWRNVFSWTIMIGAYAQLGYVNEALCLFSEMRWEGITPDKIAFVTIFTYEMKFSQCKRLHSCIVSNTFESDVFVGTALLNMYAKAYSLWDARMVFEKMPERNVISWNSMIGAYAQQGDLKETLGLFSLMQLEVLTLNKTTFVNILDAFASRSVIQEGKRIHAFIIDLEMASDLLVGTALVNMYGRCGSAKAAKRVFDKILSRDTVSWNAIIAAFVQNGQYTEARYMFKQMDLDGFAADKVTFINVLDAFVSHDDLQEGKKMHACAIEIGAESDVAVGTSLVNMYGRCEALDEARRMFDKMPERNIISWNSMVTTYAQLGYEAEALQLYKDMHTAHASLKKNDQLNVAVAALVSMLGKSGSLESAWNLFNEMPHHNVASWNTVISIYAENGYGKEALLIFEKMLLDGMMPNNYTLFILVDILAALAAFTGGKRIHAFIIKKYQLDIVLGTALIKMYSSCGSLDDAFGSFNAMQERNVVSWTTMMSGCAQHCRMSDVMLLFYQMQLEDVMPNRVTIVSMLDGCANYATISQGKWTHAWIMNCGLESVVLQNALINMYGKCGSLGDVKRIFDSMLQRNEYSWTTLVTVHAQHSLSIGAFQIYRQMQLEGCMPNEVTFMSIFFACSHTGLVNLGSNCFLIISKEHSWTLSVEYYNCIIDLLGRAGCLEEAEAILNNMAFYPTAITWTSLLGSCRMHDDVIRATHAAEQAFELDPTDAGLYVLLANLYTTSGSRNGIHNEGKNVNSGKDLLNQEIQTALHSR